LDAEPLYLGMEGNGKPVLSKRVPGSCWAALVPWEGNKFVLVSGEESVRVNGRSVPGGIRLLEDRDEILYNKGRVHLFFSEQSAIKVESFHPRDGKAIRCPLCGDLIREGDSVVRCPRCNLIFHQTEERPCWQSADLCPTYGCGQSTDLENQSLWCPDD